jgi:hypothetical protein
MFRSSPCAFNVSKNAAIFSITRFFTSLALEREVKLQLNASIDMGQFTEHNFPKLGGNLQLGN